MFKYIAVLPIKLSSLYSEKTTLNNCCASQTSLSVTAKLQKFSQHAFHYYELIPKRDWNIIYSICYTLHQYIPTVYATYYTSIYSICYTLH